MNGASFHSGDAPFLFMAAKAALPEDVGRDGAPPINWRYGSDGFFAIFRAGPLV